LKTVTARQLKSLLHGKGEIALLDVREAGQFGESHLLFATPLPYGRLELDVGALVPRKSARVVVCDDGVLGVAGRAAKRLLELGYTEVSVLDGGTRAWAAAGYALFAGVNVPSKTFAELVEHACHTPRVTVQELARMQAAGEDFVILDGRPLTEYQKMNIPGGICCPNAELPYRVSSIVRNPKTRIVVNCAGRTRSIIGAQTLINFGVPNPVVALENGTQGWVLADFKLERGSARRYPDHIDEKRLPELQKSARVFAERFYVEFASATLVQKWLCDSDRTTYLCDVRTPEEFEAGSIPGSVHAPGGQLIQATDQWGFESWVLEGGVRSGLRGAASPKPALPSLRSLSAAQLKHALEAGPCTVLDLGASVNFRRAHIPGSRWSIRTRIAADARDAKGLIVLVPEHADTARLAAVDLLESGIKDVKVLEGGSAAWARAGYPTESSPADPPDAECIDYLFFVHDRHAGNREAMKQYLAWETGLIAQLDEQDKASFRIFAPQ
jgi:rhodanese-related sulfurtransferase